MKVKVDDKALYTLTDIQKKVIQNEIPSEIFEEDMKRRLFWVINHKYEQCFKKLKQEWDSKLEAAGVESIPTNKDAYAELVFKQKNYKNRSKRDTEAKVQG